MYHFNFYPVQEGLAQGVCSVVCKDSFWEPVEGDLLADIVESSEVESIRQNSDEVRFPQYLW